MIASDAKTLSFCKFKGVTVTNAAYATTTDGLPRTRRPSRSSPSNVTLTVPRWPASWLGST